MRNAKKLVGTLVLALCAIAFVFNTNVTKAFAEKKAFKIVWSHYTGWEPWDYAAKSGILKKWADKYGISISLSEPTDYVESINQYTAGVYDGCVMTNMDALTIPAVGGVDSTAIIVGDTSHGNDGVVLRGGKTFTDIRGRTVRLVELSVSHYLLARALATNGMKESDVRVMNTSDSDMVSIYTTDSDPRAAVVTWNPLLMNVRQAPNSTMVFDSSRIPGEIMDLMVVRTDSPETLKKALTGAWYEVMSHMLPSPQRKGAIDHMAKTAGGTVGEFEAQLKTTRMFYAPQEAVAFTVAAGLRQIMEYVRTFSFDHGLYGQGAKSKDLVGISFPDGSVLGDKANVKLRFDVRYMSLAAEGKL